MNSRPSCFINLVISVFCFAFVPISAFSTEPILVKDINPSGDGSYPEYIVRVGGVVYFSADDGVTGKELWRSDGTETGTVQIKDIFPGNSSSAPSSITYVGGGVLYFSADDGVAGRELWRSDGTEAGTYMVKDIYPGENGSQSNQLTAVGGGVVFFTADGGVTGWELWRSDGTEAGTYMVRDIYPGVDSFIPYFLTANAGSVYFTADDGVTGWELWRSDGTEPGTYMIKDIYPGVNGSEPYGLTVSAGSLYFSADDGSHGIELWRSDGTENGTYMVKDICPGPCWGVRELFPSTTMATMGGSIIFSGDDGTSPRPENGMTHKPQIWQSVGSGEGTSKIVEVDADYIYSLTVIGSDIYFTSYLDSVEFPLNYQLWKSNGTQSGTVHLYIGAESRDAPDKLTPADTCLFFTASRDRELYVTDGTGAGTIEVKDICPGECGSDPDSLTPVNGKLFFSADDGVHGRELWMYEYRVHRLFSWPMFLPAISKVTR